MGLKQYGFVKPPRKKFVRRITTNLIHKNMAKLPPTLQHELTDAPTSAWADTFMNWYMFSISVLSPGPTLQEVIDDFKHLPVSLQQELHCDQQSQWPRRVTEWSAEHWKWVDEVFYGSHADDEDEDDYLYETYPEQMKDEAKKFHPGNPQFAYDELLERIWRLRMRTILRAKDDS